MSETRFLAVSEDWNLWYAALKLVEIEDPKSLTHWMLIKQKRPNQGWVCWAFCERHGASEVVLAVSLHWMFSSAKVLQLFELVTVV